MMETLGVLFLIGILGMAFWMLVFLAVFIPGWFCMNMLEKVNPRLAHILVGYPDKDEDEDEDNQETK